jgi:hypothetical protein
MASTTALHRLLHQTGVNPASQNCAEQNNANRLIPGPQGLTSIVISRLVPKVQAGP